MTVIFELSLAVVLLLTVVIDIRKHRIPNILLFAILLIYVFQFIPFFTNYRPMDWGVLRRAGYMMLVLVFLFPFFSVGALGAGDVKLISLMVLIETNTLKFIIGVTVFSGIAAIIRGLCGGHLIKRLSAIGKYIQSGISCRSFSLYEKKEPQSKKAYSVHLSIPVFLAYLAIHINLFFHI